MFADMLDEVVSRKLGEEVLSIRETLKEAAPQYRKMAKTTMFKQTFDNFTSLEQTQEQYSRFLMFCGMRELVENKLWTERQAHEVIKHLVSGRLTQEQIIEAIRSAENAETAEEVRDILVRLLSGSAPTPAEGGGSSLPEPSAAAEPRRRRRKSKRKFK